MALSMSCSLPEVSSSIARVIGRATSLEKNAIFCSWLSSEILKSPCLRIVPTLKQGDFRISEDNQEQKIAFFSREVALPITLAMLLDTSGSEQDMLSAIQDAGSQFISRIIRKGDEALVMSFDANVDLLSDFTDERGQLERA